MISTYSIYDQIYLITHNNIFTYFNHLCKFGYFEELQLFFVQHKTFLITQNFNESLENICKFNNLNNLEIIKWLKQILLDNIEESVCSKFFKIIFDNLCIGKLDIIKWFLTLDYDYVDVNVSFKLACKNGYIDVAKWMYDKYYINFDVLTSCCCIGSKHINIIQWLVPLIKQNIWYNDENNKNNFNIDIFKNYITFNKHDFNYIKNLFLHIDENIIKKHFAGNYVDILYLCSTNDLNLLVWLYEINPLAIKIYYSEYNNLSNKNVDILEWLLNNISELDTIENNILLLKIACGTYDEYSNNANNLILKIINKLDNMNVLFNEYLVIELLEYSVYSNELFFVKWLLNYFALEIKYFKLNFYDIFYNIFQRTRHLHILQWIKSKIELVTIDQYLIAFSNACIEGNLFEAKWLIKSCPEIINCKDKIIVIFYETISAYNIEIAIWLKKYVVYLDDYFKNNVCVELDGIFENMCFFKMNFDTAQINSNMTIRTDLIKFISSLNEHRYNIFFEYNNLIHYQINKNLIILKEIKKLNKNNLDYCIICYGEQKTNNIVITNCNHIYCKSCINFWYEKNKSCPYCRQKLLNIQFVNIIDDIKL